MEKKILLVGAKKVHSNKNGNDYYIIDYVDKEKNSNKSLIKNITDMTTQQFEKFKNKVKLHDVVEVIGIFEINQFDRAELTDIK